MFLRMIKMMLVVVLTATVLARCESAGLGEEAQGSTARSETTPTGTSATETTPGSLMNDLGQLIGLGEGELGASPLGAEGDAENDSAGTPTASGSGGGGVQFWSSRRGRLASVLFPDVSPEEYSQDETVQMFVESVESRKMGVPYKFYDLPVCRPGLDAAFKKARDNLGAKLQGHYRKPAPYNVRALTNASCTPLCMVPIGARKLWWMKKLIDRHYRIHLSLDSLPVLVKGKENRAALRGYPVGFRLAEEYYLYNHLRFTVSYQKSTSFRKIRITGFEVHPVSIHHELPNKEVDWTQETSLTTCSEDVSPANDASTFLALREGGGLDTGTETKSAQEKTNGAEPPPLNVVYSYEVQWIVSPNVSWADRWDVYMIGGPDDDVHYFSIVNSLMIVLLLTGTVATILLRALRRDIAGYNSGTPSSPSSLQASPSSLGLEEQSLNTKEQETGWKLVHGDVFRPPSFGLCLLSVACGTGAQLGTAVLLTLLLAITRVLSPMKKGQTLTSIIVLYVLCGSMAGYSSARLYRFCRGTAWHRQALLTATAFPGLLVVSFIGLNVILAYAGAATSVSVWTVMALFTLWVCVSTPLVFVGSFVGYRLSPRIEPPTQIKTVCRAIPKERPLYTKLPWSVLLGGVLPFGSVCIELFFIMSALWLHQLYYVVGFLLAVALILAATCAMVSIVMTYMQLCAEDYQWWWSSFASTASSGLYLFLYSLWFLASKLEMVGVLPVVVYLTYMSMISLAFALVCGSVGLFASFWFTLRIYKALKVD